MASAFETIVQFYVQNGSSKAIEESLARRRKLESDLKSIPNADRHLTLLNELAEEIALLEAGLNRLNGSIDHEPPRQNTDLAKTEVKLVGLSVTASQTDSGPPKAQPEVPSSPKQVEVVAVAISSASSEPALDAAAPEGDQPASIKIVGLTIVDSNTGANHRKFGGGSGDDPDSAA